MSIHVYPNWRVKCTATIELPISARQAWGQIRDFHQYAAHDHFHAGFLIEGNVPKVGAVLLIEHRYGPFRLRRVGKILRWREHSAVHCGAFAFSDLSASDPQQRFPHIFSIRVRTISAQNCSVLIDVTGRWTAFTPRWAAWLWLAWVFVPIVQRTKNRLWEFALTAQ